MTTWEEAAKRAEEAAQGGMFVRLKNDKDKTVGMIVGDPHIRETVFDEKLEQFEDYTEEHKKLGKKPSPKFMVNWYNPKEDEIKVFEMGAATFKSLLACKEKYGMDKMFFEITRQGAKGDTKTTYTVLPDESITDTHRKRMAELPKHDLAKLREEKNAEKGATDMSSHEKSKTNGATNGTVAAPPPAAAPAASPALVEGTVLQGLISRLKTCPSDKVPLFLREFGIQKVKDLRADQVAKADALIATWEPKPAATEEIIDPFA